jgi:hypothetical protein
MRSYQPSEKQLHRTNLQERRTERQSEIRRLAKLKERLRLIMTGMIPKPTKLAEAS